VNSWQFIKTHILDKQNGEWFWAVKDDYSIMQNEDKAGFWKCPYHNGRACMEMINRINNFL
ncbi:MAG: N-acyl-D-glucosamine 2-epimerase, partial [Panacibacter sp.]